MSSEAKRKRQDYSQSEKEIFMDIIKNSDGGNLFKIVMAGTSTNEMKFRVWEKVSAEFRKCTGVDIDHVKCRKLFARLKQEEKQKHDSQVNKQFMVECAKTGGGPGVDPPPEMDGDNIPVEKIDFLDPTPTPWNDLAIFGKTSSSKPRTSTDVQEAASCSGGQSFRFPGSSNSVMPKPNFRSAGNTPTSKLQQHRVLISPSTKSDTSPSLQVTPDRREKIQIVNEDGSTELIELEVRGENNNDIQKKKKEKEDLDPAKKYWTEMLAMQKTNIGMQRVLIQEKIKTEKLKQKLMSEKYIKDVEEDLSGEDMDEDGL